MLDIFVYVCQHVMKCVHVNMDVSSFVFQPEIFALAPESIIFLMDYMFPTHACERESGNGKTHETLYTDSMLCISRIGG